MNKPPMPINPSLPTIAGRAIAQARAAENESVGQEPEKRRAATPIEIMMRNARYFDSLATSIGEQLESLVVREDDAASVKAAAELVTQFMSARREAQAAAVAAAPYFHSKRLSAGASPSSIDDVDDGAPDRGESAARVADDHEDLKLLSAEELRRRYFDLIAASKNRRN